MEPVNTGGIQGRGGRGRFPRGKSGNPAGKPKGARHKTSVVAETILDGESAALTRRCIEMALEGDAAAMRLVMERILAPRRERPLHFEMPPLRSLSDIALAHGRILEGLANGDILPTEASALAGILEAARKSLESEQLEARVQELEKLLVKPSSAA